MIHVANLLYLVATLVPLFLSTIRRMWMLGVALVTSYGAAMFFFNDQVISVWCAFAAIESVVVLLIIRASSAAPAERIIPGVE